jgi:hypothetical protein
MTRRRPGPELLLGSLLAAVIAGTFCVSWLRARPSASSAAPAPAETSIRRPPINGAGRPSLSRPQQAAVDALARSSVTRAGAHGAGHAHPSAFGPVVEQPLDGAEATALDQQWATAVAAIPGLDTTGEAAGAGYVLSSLFAPGVGVHWVDWSAIAEPFDPARPAMLLFTRVGERDVLVGFSYWVQSVQAPAGFAGPNDVWHAHHGLCVVNGWVEREDVGSPLECPGSWLAGDDLWMLHAWVVPEYANRWGRFALANPRLCPARTGRSDLATCAPDPGR